MRSSVTTSDSELARQALSSTSLFVYDAITGRTDQLKALLDSDFILVGPYGIVRTGDDELLDRALDGLGDALRTITERHALQDHASSIGTQGCSVIVYSHAAQTGFEDTPPQPHFFCTLTWVLKAQGLRLSICHLHIVPKRKPSTQDSKTPIISNVGKSAPRVQVRSADGEFHWIERAEIVYVRAHRHYTELRCESRTLYLHTLLKVVLAQLGPTVVRIHRSYAVNPHYISSIRGEMLHLTTGEKLPIPARRIKEVRTLLAQEL